MNRYTVTIVETHVYEITVEVDADDEAEAEAKALDEVEDPPRGWKQTTSDVDAEAKLLVG